MEITLPTGGDAAAPLIGKSAASWSAIVAGAFVAASASLILIALGSGLGFASISPWPHQGASVATLAITSVIWLIVTQWLAAALGGYITGRLRTRWIGTHVHEVFFRDTAHGLVTWAVATVLVAGIMASTAGSVIGAGAKTAAAAAQGAAALASSPAMEYEVDKLLRSPPAGSSSEAALASAATGGRSDGAGAGRDSRMEVGRIMLNAVTTGSVPAEDRNYLVGLVAAKTGISAADAQSRVDAFITQATNDAAKAKEAADQARKTAAQIAIFTALAMLIGAFIASVSAAIGGHIRDEHV